MVSTAFGASGKSLRQKLIGGGVWAFIGKGATLGLNFLTMALVARLLDLGHNGAYQFWQVVVLVSAIVARAGLDNTVVYLVSSAENPGRARRAIRTVVVLGVTSSLVTCAVLACGGLELLARFYPRYGLTHVAPALGLWSAALAIQILLSEAFRGLHAIREAVLYGGVVSGALTVVGLGALFLHRGQLSLEEAAWTTALAMVVSTVIAGVALLFRVRGLAPIAPKPDGEYARVLQTSLPVLVSNVMTFVLTHVDFVVIPKFVPEAEYAIYSNAARLATLIGVTFFIANQVIPPIIGELAARGDRALMERTLRGTAFAAGVPAIAIVLVFVFGGKLVLRLAFGPAYEPGSTVLAILCIGQLANILTGSSLYALLMTGHTAAAMRISTGSGLVAVVLCIFATRAWGVVGGAAAVSAVIVVQQIVTLLVARKLAGVWTHMSARAAIDELRRILKKRSAA